MLKRLMGLWVGLLSCLVTQSAWAVAFTDGVVVDTAPVFTIAGVVLIAIGGIWGIKKVVKLLNRS